MEKTEERTVLPGYLYWTVVVVTLFIIFFPSIFAPRKEGLSTVPTVHYASKQSPEFSRHYDEFSKLALKPNQTYTIIFDESGESGLIDMTGSANPVKHYSIETTEGCTVRYTTGQLAYIPPERTGIDVKLPVIIRRNLQFRIKNTEDSNSIIITTSG